MESGQVFQQWTALHKAGTESRWTDVGTLADALMQQGKEAYEDVDLIQCRIVAHLQLEQFDAALTLSRAFIASCSSHNESFAFLHAYALYSTHSYNEALIALETHKSLRIDLLCAQIAFKQGRFEACAEIYESILKLHEEHQLDVEQRLEIYTNLSAALIGANNSQKALQLILEHSRSIVSKTNHYLTYNESCARVAQSDWNGALASLQRAETECNSLEFDDESHRDQEMLPIRTQRAYVIAKQTPSEGKRLALEALQSSSALKSDRPPPELVTLCALMLHLAGGQHRSDDARRSLRAFKVDPLRCSTQQRRVMHLNRAISLHNERRWIECREQCALAAGFGIVHNNDDVQQNLKDEDFALSLIESSYDSIPSLIAAASFAGEQNLEKALNLLMLRGNDDLDAVRARVRLCLDANRLDDALKHVAVHRELLSTRITLLLGNQQLDEALTLIDQVVDDPSFDDSAIIVAVANEGLQRKDYAKHAARLYESLLNRRRNGNGNNGGDVLVMRSRIAIALLRAGYDKEAQSHLNQLPQMNGANVNELLLDRNDNGDDDPMNDESVNNEDINRKSMTIIKNGGEKQKMKTRKKRKTRYPKGFDVSKASSSLPDPERWIPKWQRSSSVRGANKKSRRQKQQRQAIMMRGAQGAVPTIDANNNHRTMNSPPSSSTVQSTKSSLKPSRSR